MNKNGRNGFKRRYVRLKGWLTLGISGSKTLTKLCCTYKLNPALPPQTVSWPDCL